MRITEAILANNFLRDLRYNNLRLARVQEQMASGKLINSPSQDPTIADQVLDLTDHLRRAGEYMRNASVGSSFLSETDNMLAGVNDLAIQARALAVHAATGTMSASQRIGTASEVEQILNEVVDAGNRRFRGRYIFAGHNMLEAPFEVTADGVLYRGDMGRVTMRMSDTSTNFVNITGKEAFGAFDAHVDGTVDLNPALDLAPDGTRLRDLNGGAGVSPGSISLSYGAGPTTVAVDLSSAESLEDVAALIGNATGGAVTVGVAAGGAALTLSGPGVISVQEVNGNTTARDLGILNLTNLGGGVFAGTDTDPAVTPLTRVSDLLGGTMVPSGFTVTNGSGSVAITAADMGGTVQDLLAKLNSSAANVYAEISADGKSLNVYSRLNGATMSIAGPDAGLLGIATAGVRADNLFTTLTDLHTALLADDGPTISATLGQFDAALQKILSARGEAGARVQRFDYSNARQEEEQVNMTTLLSDVDDLDYSKAAMDFQQLSNQMQAALQVGAKIMPMSLADFL
jgi:flagellar hook-associated protein 3 FlgL